ncbi:N(4)-(beta-N-acetylglucosaminyl)-L-asparaginase [Lactococcus garvieae]|uniref:Isoaspartyl aminopeptidase / Asp-X dipeptidase n=1 Tax=Lactococcus garvieae DCC43 TaxID=1231377 RepID=K2NVB3_9LACT|nr:N(4)-(beta-N-acetylglucosaminyl)-L-asparaginase [Lactococcus garvieae]EKF51458.1 Isoaspartyl aminopeptidase / Asp-X dipeptidase [Lactococcus garvieae DCC43]
MWGIIATWRMAHDGVCEAEKLLDKGGKASQALEMAIKKVEDYPFYKSVGYGGLPNEAGILEMDAAYMDGDTFKIGAVAGITDIANPISVAKSLSEEKFNSMRVGSGARQYAIEAGFEQKKMLTERARKIWERRLEEMQRTGLSAYDGHDTVGMVALDSHQTMVAGTSSSGLFMKKKGRVGDSPLSGSGFYVDSKIGGATATGLGEDLMKGVLSYEIVRLMGEGLSPQEACDQAVYSFEDKLKERYGKAGAFSLVALDKTGNWGVATNVEFTFSVATNKQKPAIFIAHPADNHKTQIEAISQEWLDAYEKRIKAPIE